MRGTIPDPSFPAEARGRRFPGDAGILREVRAATAFLTRIPVGSSSSDITGAAAFALVGGLIGLVGAVPLLLIGRQAPLAAGTLAVGAIALISGGLHLDGLADTADALAAPNAAAAERARKDPRAGPAGVAAIAIVTLADAALLATLAGGAGVVAAALGCVAAGAGSRAAPPIVAGFQRLLPARKAGEVGVGAGAWFGSRTGSRAAFVSAISAIAIGGVGAAIAGTLAPVVGVIGGMVVGIGASAWLGTVRGTLDGDGFGALVEIAFTATLLGMLFAS